MNIFYVSFGRSGCSKWRAEIPAKYLRRRGHIVHSADDGSAPDCPDVIVFSRVYNSDVFRLYQWAKDRGIRVVYETDDALDLVDPWNPAFEFCRLHRKEAESMAANADMVTTTTPELAEKLRQLNPNVAVIPNSIDPEEWTVHPRRSDATPCIGWLGGSTHFLDLAIAADALTDLSKKMKLRIVLYGLTTMPSIDLMYRKSLELYGEKFRNSHVGKAVKVFLRKTEKLHYDFQPFVSPSEYAGTLCRLKFDIGIAPLADTAFNRNKSCIKYYEYGMSGAITVASDVLPYSAEVPLLSGNTREEWKRRLSDVLAADRNQIWQDQFDWIMANRNIESNVELWERAFSSTNNFVPDTAETAEIPQFAAV